MLGIPPGRDGRTDRQTDRIAIANTRSQQYLPVQLSRVKTELNGYRTIGQSVSQRLSYDFRNERGADGTAFVIVHSRRCTLFGFNLTPDSPSTCSDRLQRKNELTTWLGCLHSHSYDIPLRLLDVGNGWRGIGLNAAEKTAEITMEYSYCRRKWLTKVAEQELLGITDIAASCVNSCTREGYCDELTISCCV